MDSEEVANSNIKWHQQGNYRSIREQSSEHSNTEMEQGYLDNFKHKFVIHGNISKGKNKVKKVLENIIKKHSEYKIFATSEVWRVDKRENTGHEHDNRSVRQK